MNEQRNIVVDPAGALDSHELVSDQERPSDVLGYVEFLLSRFDGGELAQHNRRGVRMIALKFWFLCFLTLLIVIEIGKTMRERSRPLDVLWIVFLTWNCFLTAFVY